MPSIPKTPGSGGMFGAGGMFGPTSATSSKRKAEEEEESSESSESESTDEERLPIKFIPRDKEYMMKFKHLKARVGGYGEKYQPDSIEGLDYSKAILLQTRNLIWDPTFPHLLVVGRNGSGKKTRVLALLRSIFGAYAVDSGEVRKEKINGTDVTMLVSEVHIELDCSQFLGTTKDAKILTPLITGISASTTSNGENEAAPGGQAIGKANETGGKEDTLEGNIFKKDGDSTSKSIELRIFVLYNAHLLSLEAQSALRRTMETVSKNKKIILVCPDSQGIMEPIQGRCSRITIKAPKDRVVAMILKTIAERENLTNLETTADGLPRLLRCIVRTARGDLKLAIWMLQVSFAKKNPADRQVKMHVIQWRKEVDKVIRLMIKADFNSNEMLGRQKDTYFYDNQSIKKEFPFQKCMHYLESVLISVEPLQVLLELKRQILVLPFWRKNLLARMALLRKLSQVVKRLSSSALYVVSTNTKGTNHSILLHILAFASFAIAQTYNKQQADDHRHMRKSFLEFYERRQELEREEILLGKKKKPQEEKVWKLV